jgi:signal peptidase I
MRGRVLGTIGALIGALVVAVFVVLLVAGHLYRMPSSSMEPTLHCARPAPGCEGSTPDRFIVLTFLGWGRGDIVAFHTPPRAEQRCGSGGVFVKRVIGLPGDTVSQRGDSLYVDGERLSEPYVAHRGGPAGSWQVAPGTVFLLGDNRPESCDSRVFGAVPKHDVIGRILLRYWPLGRFGSP